MIKLLVIDDSPLMRRLLGELFAAESDFEVAFARDGVEGLEALTAMKPDVITLDVQMPGMNGLECLDRIMLLRPTPVVMASAVTVEGAAEALRALDLGAVDFIAKPAGAVSLRMDEFGPPLVDKVRAAAGARLSQTRRLRERLRARGRAVAAPSLPPPTTSKTPAPHVAPPPAAAEGLVIVGASTGGPPVLDALLEPLPADFPWPILIAQHMPQNFTGALARRLDGFVRLTVSELREPTVLQPGHAYVARGDADAIVTRRAGVLLGLSVPSSDSYRWHPSVDRLVDSGMEHLHPDRLAGVLLTGMGDDGAAAMTRLAKAGGRTLAQSEASSAVWGMPGQLVRAGGAGGVHDVDDLAAALVAAVAAA